MSSKLAKRIVGGFCTSAVVLACGGAKFTELSSGAGDDAGGDAGAGSDSAAGADGVSGPGRDGGALDEGGRLPDVDAGPGGTTSSLPCGTATCGIPAETCCVSNSRSGRSYACVTGAACPTGGAGAETTGLKCSSSANCALDLVCCISVQNGAASAQCVPAASCVLVDGGHDTAQLCDPKAAVTGCALNHPCSSTHVGDWGLPSSFGTCGGVIGPFG
jgi:hypothetical protein